MSYPRIKKYGTNNNKRLREKNIVFIIFFTNTITVKILFQFFAGFLSGQGTGSKTNRRGNQKRLCGVCESVKR
jgi:hypothetical protein